MPCTPCPPCEPTFPLFCEPLPTTNEGKRLIVEDSASCQKTIQTTPFPGILKSDSAGTISWEGGSTGSVVSYTTGGAIDFVNGSDTEPLKMPSIAIHGTDNVPNVLVMLADGTIKKWDPTSVGNNYLSYWDGSDWRINTLNGLLPTGNGTVFIRDNSGNLQAVGGSNGSILSIVGSTPQFITPGSTNPFPAGHLYGMILSNNGTAPNTSIDISSGECRDSTAVENIILSAALTKSITGSFTAGTGQPGLLGGTPVPGANATLHVLVIKGASGVDVGFHSSPTIPLVSLPSGYDQYYRRIGSILTDGSNNIRGFLQNGDRFLYKLPDLSIRYSVPADAISTSGTLISIKVPGGIKVRPLIRGIFGLADTTTRRFSFYDPDQTGVPALVPDASPTTTQYIPSAYQNPNFTGTGTNAEWLYTNTSSQIGVDASKSATGDTVGEFDLDVWGWIDDRNRLQP